MGHASRINGITVQVHEPVRTVLCERNSASVVRANSSISFDLPPTSQQPGSNKINRRQTTIT